LKDPYHYILVAIPDNALLDLMGEVLEHFGHHPVLCMDEASALMELAGERVFPVAVFDWELSKMNFPEIFKKSWELLPEMKRLVLINQSDEAIKNYIKSGVLCAYVEKPFDLELFDKTLSECIKKYNSLEIDE
jgi:DNA-binding NtrC family response regulator